MLEDMLEALPPATWLYKRNNGWSIRNAGAGLAYENLSITAQDLLTTLDLFMDAYRERVEDD